MRLNISSLTGRKGAFFQVKKQISGDFLAYAPEVDKVLGPVKVNLTVTNAGEDYVVRGDLSVDVALRCSRCLKPFEATIEAFVEEEFFDHSQKDGAELFWDEQILIEGNEIDITSLIEESVIVNIPMKTVCQDDCPGLCPTCGRDLAEGSCDCLSPEIDIRLAPLSKLLQSTSESKSAERRKDHGSTKEKKLQSKD